MAIPSKEEFDEVTKLSRESIEKVFTSEEIVKLRPSKQDCEYFATKIYDAYEISLQNMKALPAYKWLTKQYCWDLARKSLLKTQNPERINKAAFVFSVSEKLLAKYKPMSEKEYFQHNELVMSMADNLNKNLRADGLSEYDIEVYLKNDRLASRLHDTENRLEVINEHSTRLKNFHSYADELNWHYTYDLDLELSLLCHYRDYFYNATSWESLLKQEPSDEDIKYYENEKMLLDNASEGISKLLPYLEKQQELSQDPSGDVSDLRYRNLIAEMNIIKREIRWSSTCNDAELADDIDEPIIKRKDRTAKERGLAYRLWQTIRGYSVKSPVTAMLYLLQVEGLENSVGERTIERWLEQWEKSDSYY